MTVDIAGLSRGAVLAALYNASKPLGMGFLQYNPKPMTEQEADALLQQTKYFDYLYGRVMKIEIDSDALDPWGYDRDNGQGAVARAIAQLRASGQVNPIEVAEQHKEDVLASAIGAIGMIKPTVTSVEGGVVTMELGVDGEAADALASAVSAATQPILGELLPETRREPVSVA